MSQIARAQHPANSTSAVGAVPKTTPQVTSMWLLSCTRRASKSTPAGSDSPFENATEASLYVSHSAAISAGIDTKVAAINNATSVTANNAAVKAEANKMGGIAKAISYNIEDNAGNVSTIDSGALNKAENITITGVSTVAQAVVVDNASNSGTLTLSITDSAANLVSSSNALLTKATTVIANTQATAAQSDVGTSYVDVTGSSIAYTPPSGTQLVIYKFYFHMGSVDDSAITHFKLFLDSDEVTKARITLGAGKNSNNFHEGRRTIEWPFQISGSADTTSGKVAAGGWTSAKTIKIQYRDYSSSYRAKLHETYHFDGSASSQLTIPTISITAIN